MDIEKKYRSMTRRAFILIGKPGSGKKTFTQELVRALPKGSVFTSDTGACFRASANKIPGAAPLNTYHRRRIAQINDKGLLLPTAFATYMWLHHFAQQYDGTQPFIVIDGSPRRQPELPVLYTYLTEFLSAYVYVIYIDVTDEVAITRMLNRHAKEPRPETKSVPLIKKRLKECMAQTTPLLFLAEKKYRLPVHKVENNGTRLHLREQIQNYVKWTT
jgi:adenylate kinase family enzyme